MSCPLATVVATWQEVRGASGRLDKRHAMARLYERLEPEDLRLAATYLSGDLPQGATGAGWAMLGEALARAGEPGPGDGLTLRDVDACFAAVAAAQGSGSNRARVDALAGLLGRASAAEREFLSALLMGELRQGALKALVLEALAEARRVDAGELRRAVMNAGSLGAVVAALAADGEAALARFTLTPLTPVEPMLASTAGDLAATLVDLGGAAAVEHKLDGVRIQVHRRGDEVRIFTRSLRDVTESAPEIVELARTLPATSFILDGELLYVQ